MAQQMGARRQEPGVARQDALDGRWQVRTMELSMRALARWLTVPGSRLVFALGQILLSAGTLGGCALGLSDPTPPPGRASIEELEAYVREAIADSDPPSISITVSQGGRAVYERAFG